MCPFFEHCEILEGEKVSRNGNGCELCKSGSYQDHENTSKSCKACRTCDTSKC